MRPLYLHLRSRFHPRHASLSSDQQTPASQLRWYTPPSSTPWYKRMFRSPAPIDKLDGRPSELGGRQEVSIHPIRPPTPPPALKSSWPMRQVERIDKGRHIEKFHDRWQAGEKPENVTWAKKDDLEARGSDSFELPIEGARKSEYASNNEDADPKDVFGTFRYHKGWI